MPVFTFSSSDLSSSACSVASARLGIMVGLALPYLGEPIEYDDDDDEEEDAAEGRLDPPREAVCRVVERGPTPETERYKYISTYRFLAIT